MSDLPLASLLLVGGYGTRLRPLTLTKSKPLVEFCNKPMIEYVLDALIEVGCKKIIFALSELQNDFNKFIKSYQETYPNLDIIPSIEMIAMGTAGPIALAKKHLIGHRFFVLNSDIICKFPFKDLLSFHLSKGGEGTIMSFSVEDPSRFGVIISNANGQIKQFIEKPKASLENNINAGIYIFEPSILNRIPLEPTSIERQTFPEMVNEGQLYVMKLEGFWADIGTPVDFIKGISLFLETENKILIGENVEMGSDAKLVQNVVIGNNIKIGNNCIIENSVIFSGSVLSDNVTVRDSIVGWDNKIGNNTVIENWSFLGLDVKVGDNVNLNKVTICHHKAVSESTSSTTVL